MIIVPSGTSAQTLWNTNQKWTKPVGLQIGQLQKISLLPKLSFLNNNFNKADTNDIKEQKIAWFAADTFATNNTGQAIKFVEFFSKADTAIGNKFLDFQSVDPEKRSLAYIILALQDSVQILKYFRWMDSLHLSPIDSSQIKGNMNHIKSIIFTQSPKGKGRFTLFLSGDFLSTIQNTGTQSGNNSSVGSGSIGVCYTTADRRQSITGKIDLISTQDTVSANYGTQVLVPAKGKGFGTLQFGYSHKICGLDDTLHPWALNGFLTYSTQHWRLDSMPATGVSPTSVDTFTLGASLFGLDLTATKAWLCPDSISVGSSKFPLSFNVNMGLAERYLGGDVLKPLQTAGSSLKQTGYYANLFPTKRDFFFGLEGGCSISFGPILAEFEAYYFFPNTNNDIQPLYGLTGFQFSFGASVNLNFYHN